MEENEFENLSMDEEQTPEQSFSDVPSDTPSENTNELISAGSAGRAYDWSKAPEGAKAPPRIDLNGETVTLEKADIILPPEDRPWEMSRNGNTEYKFCSFVLHYSGGTDNKATGQQEFLSGVRVFVKEENGMKKYSHPTIMRDRKNQSSKLLGLYSDFKQKDITQVSLKEFMAFLNSKPSIKIRTEEVKNPTNGNTIVKNMIDQFL